MPQPFPTIERKARGLTEPALELEEKSQGWSRRGFLKKTGGAAIGLALADTLTGEFWWSGTNPEVRTFANPEAKRKFPHTYTLIIGGFGIADVQSVAGAVEKSLGDYGQIAYLHNSNGGFDIKDTKREARKFIKKHSVERLRLYGHSMGGMIATELTADLADDVDIDALLLDCSPASYKDVRDQERFGTLLLSTLDKAQLHLGPGARFMMEAARPLLDGRDDYLDICRHALSKASSDSCSNRLVQDQASYLRAFDVSQFSDDIPEETTIIRLRPDIYSHDGTVNNETSLPRWRDGLQHEIIDLPVIGGTHASVRTHTKKYTETIDGAIKRHHLFADETTELST